MRLVVEEVRAHQLVMDLVMVFGVVVDKIHAYWGTVNLELDLTGAIPDPGETHFDCL